MFLYTHLNGVFNWTCAGGITVSGACTGTSIINLTGGTFRSTAAAISNSVTIAGNVTLFSGTNLIAASGTPTWTYTSGTITVGTSVLSIASSMTFTNTFAALALYSLTISAAATITINTNIISCTGTLTLPGTAAVTFAGTAGWTTVNLTTTTLTATRIFTFQTGITYTITTDFTIVDTAVSTSRFTFISSHAVTRAIITLNYTATQLVKYVDPTRINSSNGQTIYSVNGVLTDSYGWANSIASGNIVKTFTGATLVVAGITKDKDGVALGSCIVYLFRDNGNTSATYITSMTSHAVTGAYSFTVWPGSTYFVVAFKAGATPVMDATDRTLVAV